MCGDRTVVGFNQVFYQGQANAKSRATETRRVGVLHEQVKNARQRFDGNADSRVRDGHDDRGLVGFQRLRNRAFLRRVF